MLDHVNLPVSDLDRSRTFYELILKPLNLDFLVQDGDAVGFGKETWEFGVAEESGHIVPIHLAFCAESHEVVDRFYAIAIESGGQDNGPPGRRKEYGELYYSAYIIDPDGHNIEAVCRR